MHKTKIPINQKTDVLGIIDMQLDFLPGGALAVPEGDELIPQINRITNQFFSHAFASQDWHPINHISFASVHASKKIFDTITLPYGQQTLWPDHCIQNSAGANIHPNLDCAKVEVIIRKGFHRLIDSYSAFFENDGTTTTGLDAYLKARQFQRVFLVGLATDFCVAYSAQDAIKLGYQVFVIRDACRGIGIKQTEFLNTIDIAEKHLQEIGVKLIETQQLSIS